MHFYAGGFALDQPTTAITFATAIAPLFTSLFAPDGVVAPTAYDEPRCTAGSDAWLSFGLAVHATPE